KQRVLHVIFHPSLLRIHNPNDDRLFPGRDISQSSPEIASDREWPANKMIGHSSAGVDARFKILWKVGDVTWLPYAQIGHRNALEEYLELHGAPTIQALPTGTEAMSGTDT
ncbi:hypothetical protein HYPSUDRAFT_148718, partial [Hypholoma sublateritium FD-334 SS-4]